MNDIVINADHLSKQYQLGELYKQHVSIRDSITDFFFLPKKHNQKQFIWALQDVSFQIKCGEIFGIIGNNGSGKSTLLKILSGITRPTLGSATIYGRVRTLLEVGTGFHSELTGKENIYLNGSVMGMTRNEISKKFDEIVDFAKVEDFLDTPIKRYSSGMSLRLAFAVAAFLEAEILFADEVLAVGDIAFQRKCLGKMNDVACNEGKTIIFISHQMDAIRSLCNQAMWLDQGIIQDIGNCNKVVAEYEQQQMKSIVNHTKTITRKGKNNGFYISKISILNKLGEHSNIFKYKSSLVIILEISGSAPANHYGVTFIITGTVNANMQYYSTLSTGRSDSHNQLFDKNTKKIRIDISSLMLSNGDYSISFHLTSTNKTLDLWEKACSFRIVECKLGEHCNEVSFAGCILEHCFSPMD